MNNNGRQIGTTLTFHKNVISSFEFHTNIAGPSGTTNSPIKVIISNKQEEQVQVFKGVEQAMESFRDRKNTRFQMLTNIVNELDKWFEVTDNECKCSLNTYLTELNSTPLNLIGPGNKSRSITQPSKMSIPLTNSQK